MKKILAIIALLVLPGIALATTWHFASASKQFWRFTSAVGNSGGSWSEGCWFRLDSNGGEQAIMETEDAATTHVGYTLQFDPTVVGFLRNRNGVAAPEATVSTNLNTNQWFYLAGTYSSTSTVISTYFYNTSSSQWMFATNSGSGNGNAGDNGTVFIGIHTDLSSIPFNGYIANCWAYNYALPTSTVQRLAFHRPPSNDPGLMFFYPGREGGGSTLVDYSVNKRNAGLGTQPTVANFSPPVQYNK